MKSPTQLFLKNNLKQNYEGINMETIYGKLLLQGSNETIGFLVAP